nr:efflux transporter outer membrane subunit [Stenotrophomonas mori]
MAARGLAAAAASLLLAGCITVGPDYQAPAPAPVVLQAAAAPVYSPQSPVASWWAQFDDPVLEQLVHAALSDNLDLKSALARVREARAVFVERRLDQAPHVTAAGSRERRTGPEPVPDGTRISRQTYQLGFDAAWELDLFGRQRRAAEAAHADLEAEWASLIDAQVLVAAEVARNYFELRGAQKRLAVAERTLHNLRDTQRLTETRWTLGAGSEQDVQSSRARLKAIEADLPQLDMAQVSSRHRLAVLLGQRPGTLDELLQPRPLAAFAKALPIGDTRDLLRRRADVRAAERRLAAATARVGVATAELFPRLTLTGFVGFLGGDANGLVNGGNKAWALTPSLSWAAFDYGSVRARLRARHAQADGVAAEYEKTVLLALEDAENALARYARQQARLLALAGQAQAAQRAETLAGIRYREGASDFLALLDAQRTQLAADDALALGEAELNVAVVAVYKALGGWGQAPAAPSVAAADAPEP